MRIYSDCYQLMSETARNIYEMGMEVKPKTYQNKNIEGKDEFITKELICEQYCLTKMPDPEYLFTYTKCKDWADAEFLERVSGKKINPGKAWELRKDVWEEFLTRGKFNYTYAERINSITQYKDTALTKLQAVINLLKDDPDTRKAILNIYGGDHLYYDELDEDETFDEGYLVDSDFLDGKERIPCSMYYDFLIRENASGQKQLNICYHQRSSDFITHFGNDVYLAWKLMEYVAEQVGILPGYLYHTIDSLHAYKKDWGKLKSSLGEQFNRL